MVDDIFSGKIVQVEFFKSLQKQSYMEFGKVIDVNYLSCEYNLNQYLNCPYKGGIKKNECLYPKNAKTKQKPNIYIL